MNFTVVPYIQKVSTW